MIEVLIVLTGTGGFILDCGKRVHRRRAAGRHGLRHGDRHPDRQTDTVDTQARQCRGTHGTVMFLGIDDGRGWPPLPGKSCRRVVFPASRCDATAFHLGTTHPDCRRVLGVLLFAPFTLRQRALGGAAVFAAFVSSNPGGLHVKVSFPAVRNVAAAIGKDPSMAIGVGEKQALESRPLRMARAWKACRARPRTA